MLRHHLALLPSEIPWRRDRDRQVFRVEARSDDGWFEIIAVNAGKQVDVQYPPGGGRLVGGVGLLI
jgi:hypothetical protein